MKWQVKYALANLNKENERSNAKYIENDVIEVKGGGNPMC
jgi:hypothetical protein